MKIKKCFSVILPIIPALFLGLVYSAPAEAAKQLEMGSTSVNSAGTEVERECEIPITLKGGFNDVNGLAFTLSYNHNAFEFLGLFQADKEVYNGDDYDPPGNEPSAETIENGLFYIANVKADEGSVLVAAAAANFLASDTADVVPFIARFRAYEGVDTGVYEVGVQKTVIGPDTAADAGYDVPTELDVAVGLDPAGDPAEAVSYPVDLVAGSITVASTYTISGKITVNGEVIPGVQIRLIENGEPVGDDYPVNEDGSFEIAGLDSSKTYMIKAVYGSEVSDALEPGVGDVYNWEGLVFGSIAGTIYGLGDGQEATLGVTSVTKQICQTVDLTGDGSDQSYGVDNLLPGDDYIVSISGDGIATIYYDGQTDPAAATPVTVTANSVTDGIDFSLGTVVKYTLTYLAGEGGSITGGDLVQQVVHGGDGTTVTAVPDEGYRFVQWDDGLLEAARTDTNVEQDITVEAQFEWMVTVATPIFEPDGGLHPGPTVDVTVNCATEGATIRYTTDENEPTLSSSQVVGDMVTISVPGVLNAKAWKDGMNPSDVKTAIYQKVMLDKVGLYDQAGGKFYFANALAGGPAAASFRFGPRGKNWIPIAGNWDLDDENEIGLYDQENGKFYLAGELAGGPAAISFRFGPRGKTWLPIAGDWDNDGVDGIGLYDQENGKFYLANELAGGPSAISFRFGPRGKTWLPIAGDWDLDGIDEIGLYDQENGKFYLANELAGGPSDISFRFGPRGKTWLPTAGKWGELE